jgi:hypothetical protein
MATLSFITTGKLVRLLNEADPENTMYIKVLSQTRLGLGADPVTPSTIIDLAEEKLLPFHEQPAAVIPFTPIGGRVSRRSGEYWFELNGRRTDSRSLRELLYSSLLAIEEAFPDTLKRLSHVKLRTRRIVARDPSQLFEKEHLSDEYAEQLGNGWYFGTNNSATETVNWLQRACSCADVEWGVQFKTNLSPSIDDL